MLGLKLEEFGEVVAMVRLLASLNNAETECNLSERFSPEIRKSRISRPRGPFELRVLRRPLLTTATIDHREGGAALLPVCHCLER